MDIALRTPPLLCGHSFRRSISLNFRPFTGLMFCRSSTRLSDPCSWRIQYRANRIFRPFCGTGDFSRKRRKKRSTRRSKGRTSVGFVPKAPAERGSQKRDQWNAEDSRTSVIPPELDSRTPDTGCSSGIDKETLEASQVKRLEGAINGKVRHSPPANKRRGVTGKTPLKDDGSVKRFIREGESSAGTVFHESEPEAEVINGGEGNYTRELNDEDATELKILGSESESSDTISEEKGDGLDDDRKNLTLAGHQNIEADNYVNGSEVLVTETRSSDITGNEEEANDLVSVQENLDYECIKSDEIVAETELLESETMGSHALVSDDKEVMDLISIQANLALVNYESVESYNDVNETESSGSEAMGPDTSTGDEKEVMDLVSVPENLAVESCASIKSDMIIDETKMSGLGSSSDTIAYLEKEVDDGVIVHKNLDLVSYQSTEYGKNVTEAELLGLATMDTNTVTVDEKEAKDSVIMEENLDLVSNESVGSGEYIVETKLLGPKPMGSVAVNGDEKELKDLLIFQENLALVNCGSAASKKNVNKTLSIGSEKMGSDPVTADKEKVALKSFDRVESNQNVTETKLLGSESMGSDTVTSEDKEVKDSTIILGHTTLVYKNISEADLVGSETKDTKVSDVKELEDSLQALDLEMDAFTHKQILADENLSKGNKIFIYPGVTMPDIDIELFLNRSLSPLKNQPDVLIMGAFNDWRWKSFTLKLEKSHLKGDWWSCKIHVPKEAYILDFVFFDGKDVYDNNNEKDFHIIVEGGITTSAFEDFLLEEKHRELERLADEQVQRERQREERRQMNEQRAASAADLAQAKLEVERKRERLRVLMKKPIATTENLCFFKPGQFKGGDLVRLYYNKISGPLAQAKDIWIHGGHNGWEDGLSIISKLVKSEDVDACWWCAEVAVPDQAIVLDWVFADGPPQNASIYDNNNKQDFHAIVPGSIRDEQYWVEEEFRIYERLQEQRAAREEAVRAKAEKTARMKAETKEQTRKTFLLTQKHIVYTDPVDVQAGSNVTVYYNPSNTVLNGKPEVWFTCSFNRWTYHRGPLPPQKMLAAENGSHLKITVMVPLDAYILDFVFSEREDGGIFDNKNDMDYHVPIFGGIAKEPPMHIVHIAVEMAPIAKVGGLGDVVTSLSRAVQELNHHVNIVFPKYDCLNRNHVKDLHYQRTYSWDGADIKVWFGKVEGLSVYFLEPQNGFFSTGSIYAGLNDGARFGFFCHAALEFLVQMGFRPDIIHCHDWTSAPVAWLYKEHYAQSALSSARVVFTIHNLEFGAIFIGKAMAHADKATTVSGTYSKEVAGNPAISPHLHKFHGILNGIDPDIWDPYNDDLIPVSYTSENVVEGKKAAKELLQQRLSLKKANLPLVGIISRLTHQKGIHLIKHAIWHTLERGGQVVLLGSAPDPRIHNDFVNLSNQMHNLHCDRARLCLTYDEPLSHLIYAGSDFILVPSIFEPCGLTQLVAMRYGSIPVVRKTGGLYDTVFDVDHDRERAQAHGLEPNGFSFEGADPAGVDYALDRAISAWYDGKEWLNLLRKRVMEQDWSWNRPALEYIELYHAAHKY